MRKTEVQFRIQAFGTTEALRTTEKTELDEIDHESLFWAFKYSSVNSGVISISVVLGEYL
jgi:predicted nicotinamide N-methyase